MPAVDKAARGREGDGTWRGEGGAMEGKGQGGERYMYMLVIERVVRGGNRVGRW